MHCRALLAAATICMSIASASAREPQRSQDHVETAALRPVWHIIANENDRCQRLSAFLPSARINTPEDFARAIRGPTKVEHVPLPGGNLRYAEVLSANNEPVQLWPNFISCRAILQHMRQQQGLAPAAPQDPRRAE